MYIRSYQWFQRGGWSLEGSSATCGLFSLLPKGDKMNQAT